MATEKHNADNERLKRRYFAYLREAKGLSEASIDKAAAAIDRFELVDSRKTKKVTDPERLRQLQARIGKIAGISERSSR